MAALKRDADAHLAPQLASLVQCHAQIILQPIFDLELPRIAFAAWRCSATPPSSPGRTWQPAR